MQVRDKLQYLFWICQVKQLVIAVLVKKHLSQSLKDGTGFGKCFAVDTLEHNALAKEPDSMCEEKICLGRMQD